MLNFMDYATPVTILPVHDSFIMHHGYETELKEFMQQHFYEIFGCSINVGIEYDDYGPHSEKPVTKDFDLLLSEMSGAEMSGAEKRLLLWR